MTTLVETTLAMIRSCTLAHCFFLVSGNFCVFGYIFEVDRRSCVSVLFFHANSTIYTRSLRILILVHSSSTIFAAALAPLVLPLACPAMLAGCLLIVVLVRTRSAIFAPGLPVLILITSPVAARQRGGGR